MSKPIPYSRYLKQLAHADKAMRREVDKTHRRLTKKGYKLVAEIMDERIYEAPKP